MASLEDLVVAVRERAGGPLEKELPEEYVQQSLTSALREFNRFRPLLGAASIVTVAGQIEYDLPAGVTDVVELWLSSPSDVPDGLFDQVTWMDLAQLTTKSWDELMAELDRRGLRRVDDAIWDWRVIPGTPPKIRLAPEPTAAYAVVLRTEVDATFAQLRPEDEEHVIRWALALCFEYLGLRRNKAVVTLPTAVGSVRLDTGQILLEKAQEMKDEFRMQLGQGSTFVAMG